MPEIGQSGSEGGAKRTFVPTPMPLIYASLGTLQNGLESVFSTIAEGVSDRSGMQLVLSVRPALDPKGIRSLS